MRSVLILALFLPLGCASLAIDRSDEPLTKVTKVLVRIPLAVASLSASELIIQDAAYRRDAARYGWAPTRSNIDPAAALLILQQNRQQPVTFGPSEHRRPVYCTTNTYGGVTTSYCR